MIDDIGKHDNKIANLIFSSVYPAYVAKVERKGRTVNELTQVIKWLTGFTDRELKQAINGKENFKELFERATLNPNAHMIKGVICGYCVEDIKNPLTQKIRYLDKLVDDLAKGKTIEKILKN